MNDSESIGKVIGIVIAVVVLFWWFNRKNKDNKE